MHRERPLQNSMFLTDTSRRQSFEYNTQQNVLKKSSTFNNGDTQFQTHFVSPNHMSNIGNSPRPLRREFFENKSLETSIGQINQKLDQLNKRVDRHDFQLSSQGGNLNMPEEIAKMALNKVRQEMPKFTSNNDVYEHIFNLKLDIKDLQQKLSENGRQNELKKWQLNIKQAVSEQNRKMMDNKISQMKLQIIKKRDQYFQSLINSIETEVSFLKKSLNNHNLQLKVSPISSSSMILLKYQQTFKARTKQETDMVINEHVYYIDNQGFLLDNNSRYIVDQKGKKVKLEEKHINMLKSKKILH